MDKLLKRPLINRDESIEGYVLRLSKENILIESIEKSLKKEISYDYNRCIKLIELLTGNILKKDFEKNSLLYWQSNNMTLPDWKRLQSTKFCAQCVAEYPVYHRYEWSLVPVTICSLHDIYLIENCENCSNSLKIKDIVYGRCLFCNHNLYAIEEIEGNLERKWTGEITELTNSIFWLMHLNIKEFYT
jgi:hypothetical protein